MDNLSESPVENLIVQPIILAGGAGTRLWPLSRAHHPKQFLDVGGTSLLIRALNRAQLISERKPIILTSAKLYQEVRAHLILRERYDDAKILTEPATRNTGLSVIYSAVQFEHEPETVLVFLPADQLIDNNAFTQALTQAIRTAASTNSLVVAGVRPSHPATSYGYIVPQQKALPTHHEGAVPVSSFVEKPAKAHAQNLIKQGALWNAGLVIARPSTIINECRSEDAQLILKEARELSEKDRHPSQLSSTPLSFDHAVLEHAQNVQVVSLGDASIWSDVGTFSAWAQNISPDHEGNRMVGSGLLNNTTDSTVISKTQRTVVTLGLSDTTIVDTNDALLVASNNHLPLLKDSLADLRAADIAQINHSLDKPLINERPWGTWQILWREPGALVKRIRVLPHRRLSLQLHKHRSEHWLVLRGTALVEKDGAKITLQAGESVQIPQEVKHRLCNPGDEELVVIEVSKGDYLGEDDIIRFEDDWER